ncbi:hypothetical protein MNEG_15839 [Monoraphidium neglectum]|uniref:Uncharacterized protein n=1 Tax=Monoraphidium neglectum TaxID=145388 RepID=A0A0D2LJH3_9CHLO|nr:hypothetical protein MNEG_15839 [Monoraphidium neglectum]KIY92124.1 hypothetical protein MNEG_15839 [Monoraphidium neglectum]|eukprot:XP_013891144.1 hypothetical protein MNEG_15839 [Monoraphidium neglectum]
MDHKESRRLLIDEIPHDPADDDASGAEAEHRPLLSNRPPPSENPGAAPPPAAAPAPTPWHAAGAPHSYAGAPGTAEAGPGPYDDAAAAAAWSQPLGGSCGRGESIVVSLPQEQHTCRICFGERDSPRAAGAPNS